MDIRDELLKETLTEDEFRVLRKGGTEAPFSGIYVDNHDSGMYHCKVCGSPLFSSDKKFDSGSGWPSFTDPVVMENVGFRTDDSHGVRPFPGGIGSALGVQRTEVYCKHCNSHLGHLFEDGPKEAGGKRYCINSVCLEFEEK